MEVGVVVRERYKADAAVLHGECLRKFATDRKCMYMVLWDGTCKSFSSAIAVRGGIKSLASSLPR